MSRAQVKRETDLQTLTDWVEPGSRVLDLGCGRGVLLEQLRQARNVWGLGVDLDPAKVRACVKRGVTVYQGDAEAILREFPDGFFQWVICSRTLQDLPRPAVVIRESLRVGRRLAVGFVNYGYWLNRWHHFSRGERVRNEVFPEPWEESHPSNPVTLAGFERFCQREGIALHRRLYLRGDWKTPCHFLPNLRAGYALYAMGRGHPDGRA